MNTLWNTAKRIFQPAPRTPLGSKEIHAFVAVSKLGNDVDALSAFDEARKTSPAISFGSIYATLERMASKGYLESRLGEPEAARGGRARKYYRATALGKEAFEESRVGISSERPLTAWGKRRLQETQAAISSLRHS